MEKRVTKEDMYTLPKIVAVDFDGTLVEDRYPDIGAPNMEMVELCRQLKNQGVALILWTCRDNLNLKEAVNFCRNCLGLNFDAVNDNVPQVQRMFNNNTRKIYADLYIDDKSIPHQMNPVYWVERLGLKFSIGKGVHNDTAKG